MNKDELISILSALVCNDGQSMMPEWDREKQKVLSLALDKLRSEIVVRIEKYKD